MILGALFVFSDRGLLPLWLVLVNLFRELLVSAIRQINAAEGGVVGANWMGKLKFNLQVIVVVMAYAHLLLESAGKPAPGGRHVVYYSALCMTVISAALAMNFLRCHRKGLSREQT